MRKFVFISGLIVIALVALSLLCYAGRTRLAASYISREFKIPVKIESLEFGSKTTDIGKLWMGNPSHSKTSTSFTCEKIEVDASLKEVIGNPLVIEDILMEDIFVGIEIYSGKNNNWNHILSHKAHKGKLTAITSFEN